MSVAKPESPPQLQICGYAKGSTRMLQVYFKDCLHPYNVLDDDLDGLVRRGCVQCRVNQTTRWSGDGLSRAERGSGTRRRAETGGRVLRQAVKLVFDCR